MKAHQLILRCMASRQANQWVAICLDFDLVAQGDTLEEAKCKLEGQIQEYVHDALTGEDQAFADQLLNRKSPWHVWVHYYWLRLMATFFQRRDDLPFTENIPLAPKHNQFA
jgi:predicted RNase H-like HicB family nuclease